MLRSFPFTPLPNLARFDRGCSEVPLSWTASSSGDMATRIHIGTHRTAVPRCGISVQARALCPRLNKEGLVQECEALHGLQVVSQFRGITVRHLEEFRIGLLKFIYCFHGE